MIGLERLVTGDPARARDRQREGLWRGLVAAAPASVEEPLQVLIPAMRTQHVWGPCAWPERAGAVLPVKGDACLVAISNEGDAWVLAWWPADYGRI